MIRPPPPLGSLFSLDASHPRPGGARSRRTPLAPKGSPNPSSVLASMLDVAGSMHVAELLDRHQQLRRKDSPESPGFDEGEAQRIRAALVPELEAMRTSLLMAPGVEALRTPNQQATRLLQKAEADPALDRRALARELWMVAAPFLRQATRNVQRHVSALREEWSGRLERVSSAAARLLEMDRALRLAMEVRHGELVRRTEAHIERMVIDQAADFFQGLPVGADPTVTWGAALQKGEAAMRRLALHQVEQLSALVLDCTEAPDGARPDSFFV